MDDQPLTMSVSFVRPPLHIQLNRTFHHNGVNQCYECKRWKYYQAWNYYMGGSTEEAVNPWCPDCSYYNYIHDQIRPPSSYEPIPDDNNCIFCDKPADMVIEGDFAHYIGWAKFIDFLGRNLDEPFACIGCVKQIESVSTKDRWRVIMKVLRAEELIW